MMLVGGFQCGLIFRRFEMVILNRLLSGWVETGEQHKFSRFQDFEFPQPNSSRESLQFLRNFLQAGRSHSSSG